VFAGIFRNQSKKEPAAKVVGNESKRGTDRRGFSLGASRRR